VYVAAVCITLALGSSHSLKDKRMVLRRVRDRVRERLGVVVNEVGALDKWQRAELGAAVVSADRAKAVELVEDVIRAVGAAAVAGDAHVISVAREVSTFAGEREDLPDDAPDDRTGAGDKAAAADDWIPAQWRDDGS
jgi:hypothetical protein